MNFTTIYTSSYISNVMDQINGAILDQIPSYVHQINIFQNWTQSINNLEQFEQNNQLNNNTLNVQQLQNNNNSTSLKGLVLKNIEQLLIDVSPSDIVDETTTCKKFFESEVDEFKRMGYLFDPESPTMLMNARTDLSTSEALEYYGIVMQGLFGDNTDAAPSYFHLTERLQWNAYEKVRGMDKHKARITFLKAAKTKLKENGFSSQNPEKAKIDKEYKKCVKSKLALGQTQKQIDRQSEGYAEEIALEEELSIPVLLKGKEYKNEIWGDWNIQHNNENSSSIIKVSIISSIIITSYQLLL